MVDNSLMRPAATHRPIIREAQYLSIFALRRIFSASASQHANQAQEALTEREDDGCDDAEAEMNVSAHRS